MAEVSLKKTEAIRVAYICGKGPYSGIGEATGKLMAWVRSQGYQPAGPLSGVYFNSPTDTSPEKLRWEVHIPVSPQTPLVKEGKEGMGVKQVSSQEVATTLHRGPYSEVGRTYQVLMEWMGKNSYQVAGPAQEVYLNDPRTTPPQGLLTEVRLPVKKR